MDELYISHHQDVNIFHFFSLEISAIYKLKPKHIYLKYFIDNPVHRWRRDFISALGIQVYTEDIPKTFSQTKDLPITGWLFDSWTFVQYLPDYKIMQIPNIVRENFSILEKQSDIIFIKRDKSRVLYDLDGNLLHETLAKHIPALKIVNFDNISFKEQVEILSNAAVLISCHGAANTNVIFMPRKSKFIEISFRNHWYCDPPCKEHFSGELDFKTKCNSHGLTYRPYYHKADYHNLAKLCDIKYAEVSLEYAEEFLTTDINRINLRKIYVDHTKVLALTNI